MKKIFQIIFTIAISGCALVQNGDEIRGEIITYGILRPVGNDTRVDTAEHVAGFYGTGNNWIFLEKTDQIPLQKGIEFGFEYTVQCDVPCNIIERVVFPGRGLMNPRTGQSESYSEVDVDAASGWEYQTSYKLSQDWELVPGRWVIEVLHRNRVIVQKEFYVEDNS